nr:MAG TPA: hypothetical protein [Caudoviricetes sp.]
MPRPNPYRPREGQYSLMPEPSTRDDVRDNRGRHSAAFAAALDRAYDDGIIGEADGALASTLLAGAWALDSFEAQNKPYGPSKTIDPILAALRAAQMTPDSRADDTDENIEALLQELAAPDSEPAE